MDNLQLVGMDGVDVVLALLRGVQDIGILEDVARILEVNVAGVDRDRRRILRVISNFINSEDFDDLGNVGQDRINHVHALLNAHFVAEMPLVAQAPALQALAALVPGDGVAEGGGGMVGLADQLGNLALAPPEVGGGGRRSGYG